MRSYKEATDTKWRTTSTSADVTQGHVSHARVQVLEPERKLGAELTPIHKRLGHVVAWVGRVTNQGAGRVEIDGELFREVVLVPGHTAKIIQYNTCILSDVNL